MKFYLNGEFKFVDMVHRYQYAVMEGDRVVCYRLTREDAVETAKSQMAWREKHIRELEAALEQDAVTRLREPTGFIREIWQNYQCQSEIAAAIRRMRRTRDSIRVVPLEVRQ